MEWESLLVSTEAILCPSTCPPLRHHHTQLLLAQAHSSPEHYVQAFLLLPRQNVSAEVQQFAYVQVRSVLSSFGKGLNRWRVLSPETKESIKSSLLERVLQSGCPQVRKALGECLSDVAGTVLLSGEEYPHLLPTIESLLLSPQCQLGLDILRGVFQYSTSAFDGHCHQVLSIARQALDHPQEKVRLAGVHMLAQWMVGGGSQGHSEMELLVEGCLHLAQNRAEALDTLTHVMTATGLAEGGRVLQLLRETPLSPEETKMAVEAMLVSLENHYQQHLAQELLLLLLQCLSHDTLHRMPAEYGEDTVYILEQIPRLSACSPCPQELTSCLLDSDSASSVLLLSALSQHLPHLPYYQLLAQMLVRAQREGLDTFHRLAYIEYLANTQYEEGIGEAVQVITLYLGSHFEGEGEHCLKALFNMLSQGEVEAGQAQVVLSLIESRKGEEGQWEGCLGCLAQQGHAHPQVMALFRAQATRDPTWVWSPLDLATRFAFLDQDQRWVLPLLLEHAPIDDGDGEAIDEQMQIMQSLLSRMSAQRLECCLTESLVESLPLALLCPFLRVLPSFPFSELAYRRLFCLLGHPSQMSRLLSTQHILSVLALGDSSSLEATLWQLIRQENRTQVMQQQAQVLLRLGSLLAQHQRDLLEELFRESEDRSQDYSTQKQDPSLEEDDLHELEQHILQEQQLQQTLRNFTKD